MRIPLLGMMLKNFRSAGAGESVDPVRDTKTAIKARHAQDDCH